MLPLKMLLFAETKSRESISEEAGSEIFFCEMTAREFYVVGVFLVCFPKIQALLDEFREYQSISVKTHPSALRRYGQAGVG